MLKCVFDERKGLRYSIHLVTSTANHSSLRFWQYRGWFALVAFPHDFHVTDWTAWPSCDQEILPILCKINFCRHTFLIFTVNWEIWNLILRIFSVVRLRRLYKNNTRNLQLLGTNACWKFYQEKLSGKYTILEERSFTSMIDSSTISINMISNRRLKWRILCKQLANFVRCHSITFKSD